MLIVIRIIAYTILSLLTLPVFCQNDLFQTQLSEVRKGILPSVIGWDNNKISVKYTTEKKMFKIGVADNNMKWVKELDYKSAFFTKLTLEWGIKTLNNKLYGFYAFQKKNLTDLQIETLNLNTGTLEKPVLLPESAGVKANQWTLELVSSKNNQKTALIQYSIYESTISVWMFDENMKKLCYKEIVLERPGPKDQPRFDTWALTNAGDLYCNYSFRAVPDNYILKVTSTGSTAFTKVPLNTDKRCFVNFEIDQQQNPTVYYTKAISGPLAQKEVFFDSYGVIRYDNNLKVTAQGSFQFSKSTIGAVQLERQVHKDVVLYLVPRKIFTRPDGSVVMIAEQHANRATVDWEGGVNGVGPLVIFFLDKNLKETGVTVMPKSQDGGVFSSIAAFLKGEDIYLFYNENYRLNEHLPLLNFLVRVINSANQISDPIIVKEKAKQEKGNLNVLPYSDCKLSDDEVVFIVSGANDYGVGNTDDFGLLKIKLLK